MLFRDDPKWQRAHTRARARGIIVHQRAAQGNALWYVASSFSRDGVKHGVLVEFGPAGVDVVCSCEGGQHGRICQHAAATLEVVGMLDPDEAAWAAHPDDPELDNAFDQPDPAPPFVEPEPELTLAQMFAEEDEIGGVA